MFRPFKSTHVAALACVTLASTGMFGGPIAAQQKPTPLFFDARRLPDMEVERRNQEVLAEQRRVAEERRLEAEANANRIANEAKAQEARIFAEAAAKKKTEDARLAAEADAKKKADEARVTATAEAQLKADEEKRLAAEAAAKKKADEARIAAAEAEAKKKADEARVAAAEAEAKKKAEEARVAAAEADAKKKADEARVAAAAEAQRKTDEERRVAAANIAAAAVTPAQRVQPQVAALTPQVTSPPSPATNCEPTKAKTSQLAGGRLRIAIESACRKGQSLSLRYGNYEFIRKLDNAGRATVDLDLFQGNADPVSLNYPDGHSESLQPAARDLAEIWKVALIWQAPVDLDLHAMENGTLAGKAGHVWSGAASTAEAAKAQSTESGRGAGFMSMSNDGSYEGSKIEVYTFFHTPDQPSGVVSMLLDYVSRGNNPSGDFCGTGAKASIPYEAVILSPKGTTSRERGVISPAVCGVPLSASARLIRDAIPDLQFGQ